MNCNKKGTNMVQMFNDFLKPLQIWTGQHIIEEFLVARGMHLLRH